MQYNSYAIRSQSVLTTNSTGRVYIVQGTARTTIDNTVHGGYATSPYTAILGGTITVSGNTDVSKHLQEMNGCSSSSVCSRQDIELLDAFVRTKVF